MCVHPMLHVVGAVESLMLVFLHSATGQWFQGCMSKYIALAVYMLQFVSL